MLLFLQTVEAVKAVPQAADAVTKYGEAPWYIQFAKDFFAMMPAGIAFFLIIIGCVLWLLKDKLRELLASGVDFIVDRLKGSSKQPVSATELARKGRKKVVLDQATERARLEFKCDHISVYGCQNGVYLRSGEGIDKFLMLSESAAAYVGRQMDNGEQLLLASDIPHLLQSLAGQVYQLLWEGRSDDWKINELMSKRGYASTIAVYITRPTKPGSKEKDVIGMYTLSWTTTELYRPDQAGSLPRHHERPPRLIDAPMEELLQDYANEFSYLI